MDGFLEKTQSSFFVAAGGEQEVDGLAAPVDGTIEIAPLPPDLDVGFVCSPALADRVLVAFSENCLQFRCEFLNPAVDVGMIDCHAALRHHFFQTPVAQRVSQIPADTGQDDILFKSVAFEVDHV
jgi:hypothetical protein